MQLTLKAARDKRGWTLQRLAEESGVNKSTVNRLERGETMPMLGTANALEDALGLKRGSILFGAPEAVAS